MSSKENKAGKRIRMYRENHGWSIWDLSQKSGVEEKVINAIEKGEVMPALGVLVKLSRALTRADDIESNKVAGEGMNVLGYASHSLALGKPDRHMDPFRIEFAADGVDAVQHHEGEELIICISGEVELTYGPDKTVLKAGDTAYYNSCVNHGLRAIGGKPASIYGIVFIPV